MKTKGKRKKGALFCLRKKEEGTEIPNVGFVNFQNSSEKRKRGPSSRSIMLSIKSRPSFYFVLLLMLPWPLTRQRVINTKITNEREARQRNAARIMFRCSRGLFT